MKMSCDLLKSKCSFGKYTKLIQSNLFSREKKVVDTLKKLANHSCDEVSIIDSTSICMKGTSKIGENVYSDIEMFDNYDGTKQNTVSSKISDICSTIGGRDILTNILKNPIHETDILNKRIDILKRIEEINEKKDEIYLYLDTLRSTENSVKWFFKEREKHEVNLLNTVFFNLIVMKELNRFPLVLTLYTYYKIALSPVLGALSPILTFIVPYLVMTMKLKLPITLNQYTSMFFTSTKSILMLQNNKFKFAAMLSYGLSLFIYFQGVLNSVYIAKTTQEVSSYIEKHIANLRRFLKAAKGLINIYWSDDIYDAFLIHENCKSKAIPQKQIDEYIDKICSDESIGSSLKNFKFLNHEIIKAICEKVYMIDVLKSCVKFKYMNMFSYPQYDNCYEDENIVMDIEHLCHPCLDIKKVITNNFKHDGRNIIITGPNAGGKSTFIKSLLINIILSQTICISNSLTCRMNTFENIISHINIPDCKGKESLFEAEMNRCKNALDIVKENKKTFIVMDELFNSTNPIEGVSGGFAICKKLAEVPNAFIVLTTHYDYLTKLEDESKFKNFQMSVRNVDGKIIFPYKITTGISKQYIALELLNENGFDESIIKESLSLKSKILSLQSIKESDDVEK